ncbi:plasma membrane localization protein, partial [Ascosphaera pollenicola]
EAAHAEKAVHDLAANPNAANDADKEAETAVRALALGCLQKIFASGSNTAQIRNSTAYILRFIVARQPDWTTTGSAVNTPSSAGGVAGCSWGRHLLAIIARSTPVQNRFIILLAAMESLLNTPMSTRKMPAQLILASLIDGLLSGPNNLIGLSVMDVLIGLLQHLLLLLRVTSGKTKRVLHRQTTSEFVKHSLTGVDGDGLVKDKAGEQGDTRKRAATTKGALQAHGRSKSIALTDEDAISDPERRAELANLLQLCIGHLATHIYYADQVSDIITMILSRIKPATSVIDLSYSPADANAHAEKDPKESAATTDTSTNGTSSPDLDQERLFSFPEAQVSALRSVKNVLSIANARTTSSNSVLPGSLSIGVRPSAFSESRNRVSIAAWDDTQWMLRDTDIGVQVGYIDALVTWLATETTAEDLRVVEPRKKAGTAANTAGNSPALHPTAAGLSNANGHGHGPKPTDSSERLYRTIANTVTTAHRDRAALVASQFLAHLHLAIYDSASLAGDGDVIEESNILRLHLVLATLVDRLGVNAIRHALPMIMRLQEDIVVPDSDNLGGGEGDGAPAACVSKAAKAVAGSLVHGCLLAIVQRFELYGSPVGREITEEIERRKDEGAWIRGISIPPLGLIEIDNLAKSEGEKGASGLNIPESATFNPFFNVIGLVDLIEENYNAAATQSYHLSSLDGSALGRPSTSASTHSKAWQQAYHAFSQTQPLPASVKESMITPWTRESILAAIEATELDAIPSLSGSRTNTNLGLSTGPGRNHLADALVHRNGTSSSESIRRLRAGTTNASTEGSTSGNPEDSVRSGHVPRRSISLRNGKPDSVGLTRRGSVPTDHRLSVGTTNTIRMNELRRVLSVVNSGSQDTGAMARRHTNLGGRRESSSLSSTYSDHPSLISAHSNLPPTGHEDRQFTRDVLQTIESVPPVPPIPSDYNTPTGSQTSISRPSTARVPSTTGGLAPPQQGKNRSNTIIGTTASKESSPSRRANTTGSRVVSGGASVKTATQHAPIPVPDGRYVHRRARHSSSVRSDRTLSLGRRADVERLINGLLDHANSNDSGDPLNHDSGSTQPRHAMVARVLPSVPYLEAATADQLLVLHQ